MPLFRKKETYNEQMLREAGLDRVVFREPAPVPALAVTLEAYHGRVRPKEWDVATTAVAQGITGDYVQFTVLPDGDLIVETEENDGDLTPLADAIEQRLSPPYKATGSRQENDLWGVGAKQIEVATFSFPNAEELELTQSAGVAELRVDGEPSDAAPPVELQRLGETAGADYCAEATHIDGDSWEVRVTPL